MSNRRMQHSIKVGAISMGISTVAQIVTIGYNCEKLSQVAGAGERQSMILQQIDYR